MTKERDFTNEDEPKEFKKKKVGDHASLYVTKTYNDILNRDLEDVSEDHLVIFNEYLKARKLKDLIWTGIRLVLEQKNEISSNNYTHIEHSVSDFSDAATQITSTINNLNGTIGDLAEGFSQLSSIINHLSQQSHQSSNESK